MDAMGKFIDVNQAACESLGYSKEELLKLTIQEIDADPSGYEAFLKIRDGMAKEVVFEVNHRRKDGMLLPVEITGSVFTSQGNQFFLAIARDLTQRKQAEEAVQEKEKRLQTLFKETLNPIFVVDENARYIDANKAGLEFLQCDRNELMDKSVWDFTPPQLLARQNKEHPNFLTQRTLETGYFVRGEIKTLLLNVVPLTISGKIILYGIGQDITERKRAEEALRESEERFRSLVESTSDGYFIVEFPSLRFLVVNQKFCDLVGYTKEEVMGMSLWNLVSPDGHEIIRDRAQKRLRGEILGTDRQTYGLLHKDGSTLWAETSADTVLHREEQVFQGTVKDITVQEVIQRQIQHNQKIQTLGTLAAGIAHEVRNPLAICRSAAEFLMEDDIAPEFRRECVKKIRSGIQRASDITEHLMKFARPAARIHMKRIDLVAVIEHALELIAEKANTKQIEAKFHFAKRPLFLKGFSQLLQQAFMNLFLNALNAMPNGGILSISVENKDRQLVVYIEDTGCGISKAELNKIFDAFYTKSSMGTGIGLGLYICHSIVTHHSGTIEVSSVEGKGSAFTVKFPLQD